MRRRALTHEGGWAGVSHQPRPFRGTRLLGSGPLAAWPPRDLHVHDQVCHEGHVRYARSSGAYVVRIPCLCYAHLVCMLCACCVHAVCMMCACCALL